MPNPWTTAVPALAFAGALATSAWITSQAAGTPARQVYQAATRYVAAVAREDLEEAARWHASPDPQGERARVERVRQLLGAVASIAPENGRVRVEVQWLREGLAVYVDQETWVRTDAGWRLREATLSPIAARLP